MTFKTTTFISSLWLYNLFVRLRVFFSSMLVCRQKFKFWLLWSIEENHILNWTWNMYSHQLSKSGLSNLLSRFAKIGKCVHFHLFGDLVARSARWHHPIKQFDLYLFFLAKLCCIFCPRPLFVSSSSRGYGVCGSPRQQEWYLLQTEQQL